MEDCSNWDTRSLEDICQMCCEAFDKAKEMLDTILMAKLNIDFLEN